MLKEACILLAHIVRTYTLAQKLTITSLERFLEYFFNRDCMFKPLYSAKSLISDLANSSLKSVIVTLAPNLVHQSVLSRVLTNLNEHSQCKNSVVRIRISEYLLVIVSQRIAMSQSTEKNLQKIEAMLNCFLND